jgi:hypothetical protein
MVIFDVYHLPNEGETWTLQIDGRTFPFAAKALALAFAVDQARLNARRGIKSLLNIQGADQVWRLFSADLRAPMAKP